MGFLSHGKGLGLNDLEVKQDFQKVGREILSRLKTARFMLFYANLPPSEVTGPRNQSTKKWEMFGGGI